MEREAKCCCQTKAGEEWVPHYLESIDLSLCEACELCVKLCPRKVIEIDILGGRAAAVPKHPENCIGDGNCKRICPSGAITLNQNIQQG